VAVHNWLARQMRLSRKKVNIVADLTRPQASEDKI
jgi:hypothetical protein